MQSVCGYADIIVISVTLYNFSIPASLKALIDQINPKIDNACWRGRARVHSLVLSALRRNSWMAYRCVISTKSYETWQLLCYRFAYYLVTLICFPLSNWIGRDGPNVRVFRISL
jgi:multimeric flavodoxin WrbA